MSPVVAALVVASAFLHALWNAVLKRQRDTEGAAVAMLVVAAALSTAAAALRSGPAFPVASGLAWALAAGVCEGGYFATLVLGFREASLGVVYTISRGGALVAIWPVSALWLGEAVSARAVGGAALVTAGLVLVGLERGERASSRGALWAALCALFIAGYSVFYKAALATGASPAAVFAAALAVALPVNAARLGRGGAHRALGAFGAAPAAVVVAGALSAASFLVFLAALARGGAGAAATLRNTSVLFTLLFARAIGERPSRRQVLGTVAVVLGAIVLGWPA
jgi:drug/metabolite transporter (DMT)-like permease